MLNKKSGKQNLEIQIWKTKFGNKNLEIKKNKKTYNKKKNLGQKKN